MVGWRVRYSTGRASHFIHELIHILEYPFTILFSSVSRHAAGAWSCRTMFHHAARSSWWSLRDPEQTSLCRIGTEPLDRTQSSTNKGRYRNKTTNRNVPVLEAPETTLFAFIPAGRIVPVTPPSAAAGINCSKSVLESSSDTNSLSGKRSRSNPESSCSVSLKAAIELYIAYQLDCYTVPRSFKSLYSPRRIGVVPGAC